MCKEIIEELCLEGAKPAHTPNDSEPVGQDGHSHALSLRDTTLYPRLVAKLNYLVMDRPDIRYAGSIMESHASSPKCADMVNLMRVRSHFGSSHFGSRSRRSLSFRTVV